MTSYCYVCNEVMVDTYVYVCRKCQSTGEYARVMALESTHRILPRHSPNDSYYAYQNNMDLRVDDGL